MNSAEFYPTASTIDCTTNVIELTANMSSQSNYAAVGLSAYYMGYLDAADLPSCYRFSSYEQDGYVLTFSELELDENPDFFYGQLPDNYYFCSELNHETNRFYENRQISAINSLAPLNVHYDSYGTMIALQFRAFVRRWQDPASVSMSKSVYTVGFTSPQALIKWLDGDETATFTFSNGATNVSLDLSSTDFIDGVYNDIVTVDAVNYDRTLILRLPYFQLSGYTQNDGYTQGNNTTMLTFGGVHTKFAGREFLQCYFRMQDYIEIQTYYGDARVYSGNYNNLVFWGGYGTFDFAHDTDSNTLYHDGNLYMFRDSTYYHLIIRPMTVNDIRFFLALQPSLNNRSQAGRYLPRIIDNQLMGTWFNYYAVDDLGTDWQKSGEIADDDYTDDMKPSPTPPDPTDDEITTTRHNDENSLPIISGVRLVSGDAFSTFYMLSGYHVAELGALLSHAPQTFWDALGTVTDYTQANLLDYLVSLKWYPLDIVSTSGAIVDTVTQDIQFGFNGAAKLTFTSTGTSYKLASVNRIFDMGNITIGYRTSTQNFLDLEPYTNVTVYLPYVGTTSLQCNDVIGHNINCTYVVDLTTGMCTVLLSNEYDTIYIGTGKIGVDISVSGNDILTQSEKIASSYIGASVSAVNNALSLGTAVVAGNAPSALSASVANVSDLATAAIGIANSKRGIPETVGAASGFGGGYTHQTPYITVKRPAVSIPAKYGHDVGYVCNRSYTIGSLSGFTVCDNPDLTGVPATATELDMIRNILCSGFYA